MIEAAAARQLSERLGQVEDRLERLLTSGWRQARAEAAALRQDADALADAGLPELGARVAAVAEAGGPDEALRAIALGTSACRLLRSRLPASAPPSGWTPLKRAASGRAPHTEALLPLSRLRLDGREVWVCTRPNRNELLLVEPPFPAPAVEPAAAGVFARLRREIGQALGGEAAPPGIWLRRRLRGTLRWQAQYPLGVQGDVGFYTLEGAGWAAETDEQDGLHHVRRALASGKLQDGTPLFWTSAGFQIRQLDRDDPAACIWLDPTAAEAFGTASDARPWAIVWLEGAAVVPVARLVLGGPGRSVRVVHLLPGSPSDVISTLA
jgi:hypothetical protein